MDSERKVVSPHSGNWLKKAESLLTRTTHNFFTGHGAGYLQELETKQKSFRADDMNYEDLLKLTHLAEWGILEFLQKEDNANLQTALDKTKEHEIYINPTIWFAAQRHLGKTYPGPLFIKTFKDKNPEAVDMEATIGDTETVHQAERAIVQYMNEQKPEELNQVLELCFNHNININPRISTKALSFYHTYQMEQQEKIHKALQAIKLAEKYKNNQIFKGTSLSDSTVQFDYNEFAEQLNKTLQTTKPIPSTDAKNRPVSKK